MMHKEHLLVISGGIIAFLLGCMMTYPFGLDQTIFSVGGELIFTKGALPYRDFLESKPPTIFFIYGFAQWLFGYEQWAVRLFDILHLTGSLILYYVLLLQIFRSKRVAVLSVLTYSILYVSGGYWETAQCESFAFLPSLFLLFTFVQMHRSKPTPKEVAMLGIGAALSIFVLFLLKFTLVFTFAAFVFYLLFFSNVEAKPRRSFLFWMTGGVLTCGAIFYFALVATGSVEPFFAMIAYIKNFAYESPSTLELLKRYFYQQFPASILISLSPVVVLLTVFGIYKIRQQVSAKPTNGMLAAFSVFAICQLCFGLLSIVVERKFAPYNFHRVYWCLIPFVAYAIDALLGYRSARASASTAKTAVFGFCLGVVVLFYSPFPRLIYHPLRWAWLGISGRTSEQETIVRTDGYENIEEVKAVAAAINDSPSRSEEVFLWGNSVGLYFYLQKVPTTICLANGQFIPGWPPQWWKETLMRQLAVSVPGYVIVEHDDAEVQLTGVSTDSYAYMLSWPELRSFVETQYMPVDRIGSFSIYKRRPVASNAR